MFWFFTIFWGVLGSYCVAVLAAIGLRRFLPYTEGIVESTSLGHYYSPGSRGHFWLRPSRPPHGRVWLNVKYRVADQPRVLRIHFWSGDRERVATSGKYHRLSAFYSPGRMFRMYRQPFVWDYDTPEGPLVRVGTVWFVMGMLVAILGLLGQIYISNYV